MVKGRIKTRRPRDKETGGQESSSKNQIPRDKKQEIRNKRQETRDKEICGAEEFNDSMTND